MIRGNIIEQIVVAVILSNAVNCVCGSRILAIFPTASYSHQIVLNEFAKQLHRRGHEIVVVTPNPNMNEVSENYTEIDISFTQEDIADLDFIEARRDQGMLSVFKLFWDILDDSVAKIYELPELRKLYAPESGEKFDLVIVEAFIHQGLFSLAHRFDAPLIGITSLGLSIPFHYVMGNPMMTSHPSIWELEYRTGTNVPLWRKIWNFVDVWRYYYEFQSRHLVRQNALSKKYLGKDTPDIWDIQNNISFVLYNQDPVISYGRPNVPGVIPFRGFHISKKLQPLSKDLQDFLDGAKSGFIYMSLGTNAKSKFLPNETKEMFLQIFSKLPQRVLWKFESDLHGKSDNIFISKWLPQQTVLSHPNVKLFIYQGGLQSTEEAIHYKVPLLGIPVLADQDSQVNRMVDHGVAKRLEILTLEKVQVEEAIHEIQREHGETQCTC
ncbi:2-hydroxyacylsphingosine 1-beta-galactosyltransferase isoform X2 [Cephus cinctus]|uniref:2-hydroxyacylsphingosine 1-beta-galactosyltransferase isoform X2 n=1 Tax=Cephus cinctus TaxID=211228 RepID=A0AAJ7FUG7_CEPCN|nr:2-hydroxyacylsphingosine 1-beta-galactosyltransferase isoform X2 [Cephus cinctus]